MFDRLRDLFTGGFGARAGSGSAGRQPGDPAEHAPDTRGPDSDAAVLSGWTTEEQDGRRVDVFVPDAARPLTGAVLFLHGHGQVMLSQNPVFSRLFRQHQLAVVCPDGRRSWWLDVRCEEFDSSATPQQWLLESIIPLIERRFRLTPPRIALLGVSMGGQGVLQLAYRHASLFPVVAAISPAVDFHHLYGAGLPLDQMFPDGEAARQATVVLKLHPLAWPRHQYFCCDPADRDWFDGCARLGMKLASSGIMHERDLETSHGGHSWDYFNHMADRVVRHIATGLTAVG